MELTKLIKSILIERKFFCNLKAQIDDLSDNMEQLLIDDDLNGLMGEVMNYYGATDSDEFYEVFVNEYCTGKMSVEQFIDLAEKKKKEKSWDN